MTEKKTTKTTKKKTGEPTIKEYLTYREARKLMASFKATLQEHEYRWKISIVEKDSLGGRLETKLKIKYEGYSTDVSKELAFLIEALMEQKVECWYFYHQCHDTAHKLTIEVEVKR